MILLTEEQIRVIGALIEKERTTPEYYPLTVNSLTAACNQKSSREPVVQYSQETVEETLTLLREIPYVAQVTGSDIRVPKYKQIFTASLSLDDKEAAVLCVLMLRGFQTVGEIKGRTGRMYEFNDLSEVEQTLQALMQRPEPLVTKLPKLHGRDHRFAHLLNGTPRIDEESGEVKPLQVNPLKDEIAALRAEVDDLKKQFAEFRKQFE